MGKSVRKLQFASTYQFVWYLQTHSDSFPGFKVPCPPSCRPALYITGWSADSLASVHKTPVVKATKKDLKHCHIGPGNDYYINSSIFFEMA